jgi:hypothetical protein
MKPLTEQQIYRLTSEDAWCWLFDSQEYGALKPNRRPSLELKIDEEIQNLINRRKNKNSKIRLSMDDAAIRRMFSLASDGPELCPFFASRHLLWRSLMEANRILATASVAQKRVDQIERMKSAADILRGKMDTLAGFDIRALFDNPYNLDGSSFEVDEHSKQMIGANSLAEDLERLFPELYNYLGNLSKDASAEIRRLSPASNRGDIWRQAFVEGIGYSWRLLTGSDPARNGPFHDFAEAAYYSIGGSNPLDRTIRTVLENVGKRPEDDRFDRDCRKYEPDVDGYVPKTLHRDGQRIVQRGSVWAPYYFDPDLTNYDFEPFGEEAEAVQESRKRRLYGDLWTEDAD